MNICDLLARAAVAACFLIAELAVPVSARAQPFAGNPSSGRQVATTICGSCHQVIGGKGRDGPPSFVDVASIPSTTALSLKVFLRSNHKEMPDLIISAADTDDLIAYILSLKEQFAPIRQ
jgi:mono/diheme cytochrome c family protein